MAGVRQENGKIVIRPRLLGLPDLTGTAVTPLGSVEYHYQSMADGTVRCELALPDDAEGLLITPDGTRTPVKGKLSFTKRNCSVVCEGEQTYGSSGEVSEGSPSDYDPFKLHVR